MRGSANTTKFCFIEGNLFPLKKWDYPYFNASPQKEGIFSIWDAYGFKD